MNFIRLACRICLPPALIISVAGSAVAVTSSGYRTGPEEVAVLLGQRTAEVEGFDLDGTEVNVSSPFPLARGVSIAPVFTYTSWDIEGPLNDGSTWEIGAELRAGIRMRHAEPYGRIRLTPFSGGEVGDYVMKVRGLRFHLGVEVPLNQRAGLLAEASLGRERVQQGDSTDDMNSRALLVGANVRL